MKEDGSSVLRNLPSIGVLLEKPALQGFAEEHGVFWAKRVAQNAVAAARAQIKAGFHGDVVQLVERTLDEGISCSRKSLLQHVINGTGIVLHTNLGRAPWNKNLLDRVSDVLGGYCNLEYDLATGARGGRGRGAREGLERITGADKALIVNNNAAAVLLILFAFARKREVIVSRSELVQIGGGFRIPDILAQSGATMVEVGTTNITDIDDYRSAMNSRTAMILKVHQSNFSQQGFTQHPSVKELSALKSEGVLLVHDLGSGNLLSGNAFDFLQREPPVSRSLIDGADVVCFSGDKLVGGCQAGIILGRRDLVEILEQHPLMRAVRPDKFVFSLLQEVIRRYETEDMQHVPACALASQTPESIKSRIVRFIERAGCGFGLQDIIDTSGEMGGGSLPGHTIPSCGLVITGNRPSDAARWFEAREVPVIGVVQNNRFIIDFLTVFPEEEGELARALTQWRAVIEKT